MTTQATRPARARRWRILLLAAVAAGGGAAGWAYWSRAETAALLRRGEEALEARDYPAARDHLDRYLAARPADARAHLLAARASRRMREYPAAREHLRVCRELGADREAVVVEEALIDLQRGDTQPVEFLRERARRDDDLALVILEVLIQHDIDTDQLRAALDGFTRYLARRPDDLQALLGRGHVWEKLLSFPDSLNDYRAAVSAHPADPRARLKLAETELLTGTPQEARTHYRWLAENQPPRPEVRLGLARCARRVGEPGEAAALLDGLLKEAPDHGEALWERGELELDAGRPAAAEPLLRRAAARLPFDRRVQYSLYRCLVQLDRVGEAAVVNALVERLDADVRRMGQITQEVMRRPGDAALRCEGGLLLIRNGEREQGLRWLRMALRIDPDCEPARTALAEATSGTDRPGGGNPP